MKSKLQKPARKGIPALIWVWLGWLVFWLLVGALPRGSDAPAEKAHDAAVSAKPLAGYVNDFAAALTPAAALRLEAALDGFEKETSTQLAVALYPRLPGVAIEDFALEVADLSRLGRKGLDNGAILYVFVEDHLARLEVGYGLEGSLTDIQSHRILDAVFAPPWNAGKRDAAVEATVAAVMSTVREDFKAGRGPSRAAVFWRQLRAEIPKLIARLPRLLVAVPIEGRFAIALFGSFFILGFVDGFRQARVLVRNAFLTVANLRAGRPAFARTADAGTQSMVDSFKVLVLAACVVAALAGVVMIAGGGAFGSAGSTLRW